MHPTPGPDKQPPSPTAPETPPAPTPEEAPLTSPSAGPMNANPTPAAYGFSPPHNPGYPAQPNPYGYPPHMGYPSQRPIKGQHPYYGQQAQGYHVPPQYPGYPAQPSPYYPAPHGYTPPHLYAPQQPPSGAYPTGAQPVSSRQHKAPSLYGQETSLAWQRMQKARAQQEAEEAAQRDHSKYVREMIFEGTVILFIIIAAILVTYFSVYYLGWGETMRENGLDYLHQWSEAFMIWLETKL